MRRLLGDSSHFQPPVRSLSEGALFAASRLKVLPCSGDSRPPARALSEDASFGSSRLKSLLVPEIPYFVTSRAMCHVVVCSYCGVVLVLEKRLGSMARRAKASCQ